MLKQLMKLFGRQEKSSKTAHRRLRMVLVMDRIGLAPHYLEAMRDDIVEVVSNYLVVDRESMELEVRREGDSIILVSNIPVREVVRGREASLEPAAAD